MRILPRQFYDRETAQVALDLLGMLLVVERDGCKKVGLIVEVEAYLGEHDLACHTSKGKTPRNEVMFGPPGHAYVYMIYGIHHCLNVVTEPAGRGCAVLIRALEPLEGISGKTSGPGLLCKALGVDRGANGLDLTLPELCIVEPGQHKKIHAVKRPRIGVDYAGEWAKKPLRFYIRDNPFISRP